MASAASVGKHPIHPMLVVFPLGLWVFSLACDVVRLAGAGPAWSTVALYTMVGGIIGAMMAALPGLVDLLTMPPGKPRRLGVWHMVLNVVASAIFIVNALLRASNADATMPLVLSIVGVVLITAAGWFGGEMVYVHGVGVDPRR